MADKTTRERQERFRNKHEARGNKRIAITVPQQHAESLHRLAAALRDGSNSGIPDPEIVRDLEDQVDRLRGERDQLRRDRDDLQRQRDDAHDKNGKLEQRLEDKDAELEKARQRYDQARDKAWELKAEADKASEKASQKATEAQSANQKAKAAEKARNFADERQKTLQRQVEAPGIRARIARKLLGYTKT